MKQTTDRQGKMISAAGIALNAVLAVAKIAAGAVAGLVSVVADGLNNLSDCGSGVISFVSFRVAEKPADREHPYGHRRAEYVASMLIAFLVLMLAVELFRESLGRALGGASTAAAPWLYAVLGASVAIKAGMFVGYRVVAKKIDSDPLRAAALDSACDCLATAVVIVGAVLTRFTAFPADAVAGLLVALFIAWQGIAILREAGSKLLGRAPDPALVARVRAILLSGDGVLGIHDLKIYGYGKGAMFATAHAEMDAATPAALSHEVIDALERRVAAETGVTLTVHLDPVVLNDAEAAALEQRVRAAVEGLADGMNIHDFRLVRGAVTKAVFEVGIPFDCPVQDAQLKNDIERAVKILSDCEPVVTVERE